MQSRSTKHAGTKGLIVLSLPLQLAFPGQTLQAHLHWRSLQQCCRLKRIQKTASRKHNATA